MTGSRLPTGRRFHVAAAALFLAPLMLVPLPCLAESGSGGESASARLRITVVVPPVFRVLQVTPTAEGYDYRVWTNMKSIVIGGRVYRFERIGETTLKLPASPDGAWIVYGL
ncbi:hypothetical protein ACSFBI_15600 [Variovorax sp. RB3P1]|jgi:hypothetical protein|uniref:hypothetical protein n=1 Tax=Variovorax sp. RB3P1 TaxID=3443732 RepID=UPI003F468CD7